MKIVAIFLLHLFCRPSLGYEFIAGYLYWYPHIPFSPNSAEVKGSVNLRAVWNISSFNATTPSRQSCPTFQFSKGALECQSGCIDAVPTVLFQCTDVNVKQGWVAAQMIFDMDIRTNETMKLVFSGIDWPPTNVTDEAGNSYEELVSSDKMEFIYSYTLGSPVPQVGSFPWPIVVFNLSCYDRAAVSVPTFGDTALAFWNLTTLQPSFTYPDGSNLHIQIQGPELRLARQVLLKNGRWGIFSKSGIRNVKNASELQLKFQHQRGLFPVSLNVSTNRQQTPENKVPVKFMLEIVGELPDYKIRQKSWYTYDVMFYACSCSCSTYESDVYTLMNSTTCVEPSSELLQIRVFGGCTYALEETVPPGSSESVVTSVKSMFVNVTENAEGLAHLTVSQQPLSYTLFRTHHLTNVTLDQPNIKIVDFVHLESSYLQSTDPKRYSVIQLRPEYSRPLEIVKVYPPNGTTYSLPSRIEKLYIEFNQHVVFHRMPRYGKIGELCPLDVNEYHLPRSVHCFHIYVSHYGIFIPRITNGTALKIYPYKPYIKFFENDLRTVGSWYFKIYGNLVKSPFICSETAVGGPSVSHASTWQILVTDEYDPKIYCYENPHYFSKTALSIKIVPPGEPLRSYTCHLNNLDSPSKPEQYPCYPQNANYDRLILTLNETFVNKSWTLSYSQEDLYGNVASSNNCLSFYVDLESPNLTLNSREIPDGIGLHTRIGGYLFTCTDNSANSSIFESYSRSICTVFYQITKRNSSSEEPLVYLQVTYTQRPFVTLRTLTYLHYYRNAPQINESGLYDLRFKAKDQAENWSPVVSKIIFVDADYPIITGVENKTMNCSQLNPTSVENNGQANGTDKTSNISLLEYSDKIKNVSLLIRTWTAKDSFDNLASLQQYLWFPNDSLDVNVLNDTIYVSCENAWKFNQRGHSINPKNVNDVMIAISDKCGSRSFRINVYDPNIYEQRHECDQQRQIETRICLIEYYWYGQWQDVDLHVCKNIHQTLVIGPMRAFFPDNNGTEIEYINASINFQWSRHPDPRQYGKTYKVFVWKASEQKPNNATFVKTSYKLEGIENGFISYLYRDPSLITFSQSYKWQVVVIHSETDHEAGPVWTFSTMGELCSGSCNGNGVCVGENRCLCFPGFSGDNCSSCDTGHWGPNCDECPECVNGECNQDTGLCVCSDQKWAGDLCNDCAVDRIGSNCEKLPFTERIVPDSGSHLGGTLVSVKGYNFNMTTNYTCMFDSLEVSGTTASSNLVQCTSPQHAAGQVSVSLKDIQSKFMAHFLYVVD